MRQARRPRWVIRLSGLILLVVLGKLSWEALFSRNSAEAATFVAPVWAAPSAHDDPDALTALARRDPLEFLRLARQRCAQRIADYRCLLLKQERLDGRLTPVQRIELAHRARPRSVYLHWLDGAGQAQRAVYVAGRDVGESGEALAVIEPACGLLRIVASRLRVPVNGGLARAASLQTLDRVGYEGTFAAVEQVNARAASRGELTLRYAGVGRIDGRPTYVLVRELPCPGPGGHYPNARLVLHLDREWLLPVGVYTYADAAGQILLGSYTMTAVQVNVGLGDSDFAL